VDSDKSRATHYAGILAIELHPVAGASAQETTVLKAVGFKSDLEIANCDDCTVGQYVVTE
jgi:hypothetical protein